MDSQAQHPARKTDRESHYERLLKANEDTDPLGLDLHEAPSTEDESYEDQPLRKTK